MYWSISTILFSIVSISISFKTFFGEMESKFSSPFTSHICISSLAKNLLCPKSLFILMLFA